MDDLISRAAAVRALASSNGDYLDALERFEKIPAVDAVPVVHAHWIETKIPANTTGHGGVGQDKKNGWLCSNCRCAFDAKLLWCQNYCPNCGALMDGERRDANDAI